MKARARVLSYVQHLLGIGHLVRAGRIAAALAETFDVRLVVGGEMPPGLAPPGVDLVRLPPVKAGDGGFHALAHPDNTPFGDADKAARRDLLLTAFDAFAPDALILEAFPFGRRPMRFELLPLLERALNRPRRPLIAASVRDILQDTAPERQRETVALVERFFDLVLVHGDPAFSTLPDSFPAARAFADRIVDTGLVGPEPAHRGAPHETFDVIVSVGGGAVGASLLGVALAARPLTRLRDARWLVLSGPNGAFEGAGLGNVTVRPFVADLPARLARARLSVSQAGYNTVADLVHAGCRAVLVPYAGGGETEQTRRAALLEARGWVVAVEEARLDAPSLAAAIERALALPWGGLPLRLDGAARTRDILRQRLDVRRPG